MPWLLPLLAAVALGVALVTSRGSNGAPIASGARVYRRDRADGVDSRLQEDLDEWERSGPFPLTVGLDGGLRIGAAAEARQASYFAQGKSKARTLSETPHGRAGAVDLYPTEEDGRLVLDEEDPRWERMGSWFEARGRVWGGRWGWDRPHVELADWRLLPYPPRREPVA